MATLAAAPLAADVIRQSLIPIGTGYLLVMAALALGLRRLLRPARDEAAAATPPPSPRSGWLVLLRHVAATIAGGYLLLMAVVFGYYYAVARVSGNFLSSAVTGPALLLAVALPVFAVASWLLERWRRREAASSGDDADPARQDPRTPR